MTGISARSWLRRLRGASRSSKIACVVFVAGAAAITVVSVTVSGSAAPHQPPAAARNFTLGALGHPGSKISLAGLAGKPVMVNFFASWCPPCKRETPLLARFYRQAGGRVEIIGIDANDSAAAAQKFLRQAGVTYPVAFDPYPASVTTSYGVYGLPQTFFLNARHQIVKHVLGALTMKQISSGLALMGGKPAAAALARPGAARRGQE
jgi:cytochrome c biogenesis protein CcmG/thiol:disulfide interchange protein DsbE